MKVINQYHWMIPLLKVPLFVLDLSRWNVGCERCSERFHDMQDDLGNGKWSAIVTVGLTTWPSVGVDCVPRLPLRRLVSLGFLVPFAVSLSYE